MGTIFMVLHLLLGVFMDCITFIAAFAFKANFKMASLFIIICCFIFIMFAGVIVRPTNMPSFYKGLSYISPLKYAWEGMALHLHEAENNLAFLDTMFGRDEDWPWIPHQNHAWIGMGSYLVVLGLIFLIVTRQSRDG